MENTSTKDDDIKSINSFAISDAAQSKKSKKSKK